MIKSTGIFELVFNGVRNCIRTVKEAELCTWRRMSDNNPNDGLVAVTIQRKYN